MIKAVIFDFFGVLVTEGLQQFLDIYLGDQPAKRRRAKDLIQSFSSGGRVTTYRELVEQLAQIAGVPPEEAADYLDDNRPNKLLFDYIREELKGKYKVAILSNTGDDWVHELLKREDLELFDDVVLSYKFGVIKPHADIYEISAERLGVKPEECVFIDDRLGHCEGAKRVGMKAILYQDFPQFKKEITKHLATSPDN